MNNSTKQTDQQEQFSITFSRDEKWLYEWVNEQVRTLPFTRAGYTKRLYMNDYQRMKCNGGKRKYPATTSAVIYWWEEHTHKRHMAFNNTLTSNQKVKDLLAKLQKFDAFRFKYESAQQYIEDRMNMDLARLKKNPKNLLNWCKEWIEIMADLLDEMEWDL